MPRIRTPWDRDAVVNPTKPGSYSEQNVDTSPDIPACIDDPVAPAPLLVDRPAPTARFEAKVLKNGKVELPLELVGPVMSLLGSWWREQPDIATQAPPSSAAHPGSGPPDGYIDQNDGRVPKAIYLRLSREGAFPTTKVGKKVLAKWSDVESALIARRRKPRSRIEPQATDDLDQIRRDMGLVPRGGR